MPKWGLTPDQIKSRPWGLDASDLAPYKIITDPVHGDIYLNRLETQIVDSVPMQRLRRVRQLGTTHLVYPGATHSRFSHSLGVLRSVQDLLDSVIHQHNTPHPVPDLFIEWLESEETDYDLNLAECTVLARLGGLLHDLCHVPFGHSVEDDLGFLIEHDRNVERFERLWEQIDKSVRSRVSEDLLGALKPLILSKYSFEESTSVLYRKYSFVEDIVSNTICADLLDYIRRDHMYTGLPSKVGKRVLNGFYVTPERHPANPAKMVMRVTKGGQERADVISELFKYLRYRYELSERALVHHAKLAADAMVGKMLEMWRDLIWIELAADRFPQECLSYNSNITELQAGLKTKCGEEAVEKIGREVTDTIEKAFIRHGDDGLIEHIIANVEDNLNIAGTEASQKAVKSLAEAVQNRQLFKSYARCSSALSQAEELFSKFGHASKRRELEEGACRYAGIEHSWHVLLWLPNPNMRLKAAEVLVEDANGIMPLIDKENVGRHRGDEIYQSHRNLWEITIFASKTIDRNSPEFKAALAWLSENMGIDWDQGR
ncbi:MAG: hypothetical protein OEY09_19635 [Gammaproteobacteria bacterium]|nr:hypothetical protein [Gammaproteobacteria bacterium]